MIDMSLNINEGIWSVKIHIADLIASMDPEKRLKYMHKSVGIGVFSGEDWTLLSLFC